MPFERSEVREIAMLNRRFFLTALPLAIGLPITPRGAGAFEVSPFDGKRFNIVERMLGGAVQHVEKPLVLRQPGKAEHPGKPNFFEYQEKLDSSRSAREGLNDYERAFEAWFNFETNGGKHFKTSVHYYEMPRPSQQLSPKDPKGFLFSLSLWLSAMEKSVTKKPYYIGQPTQESFGPLPALRTLLIAPSEYFRDATNYWDMCELVIAFPAQSAGQAVTYWISTENYKQRGRGMLGGRPTGGPSPDLDYFPAPSLAEANDRLRRMAQAIITQAQSLTDATY